MKKITELNLAKKVILMISSLMIFTFLIIGYILSESYNSNLKKTIMQNMSNRLDDFISLVDQNRLTKLDNIKTSLKYADELFYNQGHLTEEPTTVEVTAIDQITKEPQRVIINELTLNSEKLRENYSLVDKIKNETGVLSTIFQKIPEGFLRISTNVKNANGERAIYTYIPNSSPVAKSILSGQTYYGRAFVVDDWYTAGYEPILIDGQLKGMLFVGIKEKNLSSLKKETDKEDSKGSAHPFIIDKKGNVILSQNIEEKNIAESKFFKEINNTKEGFTKTPWTENGKTEWQYYKYYEPYESYIGISANEDEIFNNPVTNFRYKVTIGMILSIIIISLVIFFIVNKFIDPILVIEKNIRDLALGKLNNKINITRNDEIGDMITSLNNLDEVLKNSANFADEIGKGNFTFSFEPASKDDKLGNSLIRMRSNLEEAVIAEKKRKEEDAQRTRTANGLAQIGDILRNTEKEAKELYDDIIAFIVKYTECNQGGLFIINDDNPIDVFIELKSCYAYNKKKYLTKRLGLEEGLLGASMMEKETIYLTEIPDQYIEITSGLGKSNPKCILIVPLKVNDNIFGVIELASFKILEKWEIEMVEKMAEIIGSTISNIKINERTKILLAQSQRQTEQLRSQEEEMRQNMEELSATQEESQRKAMEMEELLRKAEEKEEELKQNMEELAATQEESNLKAKEMERLLLVAAEKDELNKKQQIELQNKVNELTNAKEEIERMGKEIKMKEEKLKIVAESMEKEEEKLIKNIAGMKNEIEA
ncbi:MAG: Cache 3/Cache 2 fusion domain-containing protein [Bacteroidota bacterium]|nr:Cache 3/Cache 2 fusion domain-containing protein [Bacteroidota bacterium]